MSENWDGNYHIYILTAKRLTRNGKSRIEFIKVGHAKNVEKRFRAINFSTPMEIRILGTISSPDKQFILGIEKAFKRNFPLERAKGEWFIVYEDSMIKTWYLEFFEKRGLEIKKWG